MEGQQGGDLDPGTGRDMQLTEKGGASYLLFIYPFHCENSRGMLEEAKGDGGVKTDCCELWRSRLTFLPNVWVLPIEDRLARAHTCTCCCLHGSQWNFFQIAGYAVVPITIACRATLTKFTI